MTQKNVEKMARKAKRKPPIPFTKKTPSKAEYITKAEKKYKKGMDE